MHAFSSSATEHMHKGDVYMGGFIGTLSHIESIYDCVVRLHWLAVPLPVMHSVLQPVN